MYIHILINIQILKMRLNPSILGAHFPLNPHIFIGDFTDLQCSCEASWHLSQVRKGWDMGYGFGTWKKWETHTQKCIVICMYVYIYTYGYNVFRCPHPVFSSILYVHVSEMLCTFQRCCARVRDLVHVSQQLCTFHRSCARVTEGVHVSQAP